jgi:hypothetical protein
MCNRRTRVHQEHVPLGDGLDQGDLDGAPAAIILGRAQRQLAVAINPDHPHLHGLIPTGDASRHVVTPGDEIVGHAPGFLSPQPGRSRRLVQVQ